MILNWKPITESESHQKQQQHCPCGLPNDCLCSLHNVQRAIELGKYKCIDYVSPPSETGFELPEIPKINPGELCLCNEICTCDIKEECFINGQGCIWSPNCTCGWTDLCYKGHKSKIVYKNCTCGEGCPCFQKEDCYRIPLIVKKLEGNCNCNETKSCDNFEECYFRQVKSDKKCICGSGVNYTDCKCFNQEYVFNNKWPACKCEMDCKCPDRETCFIETKKTKCLNCNQDCICGYKQFCNKITEKKSKCNCNLLITDDCKCFDQDKCIYTGKFVQFGNDIGWKIKPINRILPLLYEKYNPDGSFKTPYSTAIMIKFLNKYKEVLYKHPFQITANINELRRDISIIFKLDPHKVMLRSHGQELHATLIVAELGYKPYDIIELFLDTQTLTPQKDCYAMVIPDIITIPVKLQQNLHKDVTIEIYDKRIEKPFLGGYKHKKTGVEYHHAFSQTGVRSTKTPHELLNDRDTQTFFWRNRLQVTSYSQGTQMTTNGVFMTNVCDKIVSYSGSYEDSEAWEKRLDVLGKIKTIQRYFRAWKMKKALHFYHHLYWEYVENAKLNKKDLEEFQRQRRQNEIVRKTYPRSRSDYAMLYGMLARWKKDETERICKTYTKPSRIAELYILLDREVKILNIIEKHRRENFQEIKNQQELKFFQEISSPIKWTGYNHLLIEMHTEKTQKAERYKQLYVALSRRDLPIDQRITLLLSLKYALKDHKCRMAFDLIDLLDQECQLLLHGVGNFNLEILRKRQQTLLMEHVKNVQCNDCLTKRQRGLREIHMEKDMIYCKHCQKLKSSDNFGIGQKVCIQCGFIDITTKPYIDIAPYQMILDLIIRDEKLSGMQNSCIMYMITNRDIQYIVDVIWHGHSILTETRDLYKLRLCRWNIAEYWSPWNCVLFSIESAQAHKDVSNPREIYGQNICDNVVNKHLLSKQKFQQMYLLNEYLMKTEEIKNYMEEKHYTPVPSEIFCNQSNRSVRSCNEKNQEINVWNIGENIIGKLEKK